MFRPLCLSLFACALAVGTGPAPLAAHCHADGLATCVGATPCKACRTCTACKYCSQPGKTCGACRK